MKLIFSKWAGRRGAGVASIIYRISVGGMKCKGWIFNQASCKSLLLHTGSIYEKKKTFKSFKLSTMASHSSIISIATLEWFPNLYIEANQPQNHPDKRHHQQKKFFFLINFYENINHRKGNEKFPQFSGTIFILAMNHKHQNLFKAKPKRRRK